MSSDSSFSYRTFDIAIERAIDIESLGWPSGSQARDDAALGGNHDYMDLRWMTWSDARDTYAFESSVIEQIERSTDPEAEYERQQQRAYEEWDGLHSLDIGVASAVIALSAAEMIPFVSCNGGAFGGRHYMTHPLVGFFARPRFANALLFCAGEANIGIRNTNDGQLLAYARDIRDMRRFALALTTHSKLFSTRRRGPR